MTDSPLTIEVLNQGATVRLVLGGELDLQSTQQLEAAVRRLREQGVRHLIVDLRSLGFIDSSGLHALVALDASARQNGHNTSFVKGGPAVWRPLEIIGMTDHFVWVEHPDELSSPTDTAAHRQAGQDLDGA